MVCLEEDGVSDVVVIAFMFVLLVLSATVLFGFTSQGLKAAASRQTGLKANYLHRTLEKSEVISGITALEAAAEQLVLQDPTVDNKYLKSWMENTLGFLKPSNYGVELRLTHNGEIWRVMEPENVEIEEPVTVTSSVPITKSGGDVVNVNVEIMLFKI